MKQVLLAKVEAGRLHFVTPGFFASLASELDGQTVQVTIETKFSKRSTPQNAYYHGIVIPMVQEGLKGMGFEHTSADFTHSLIKCRFLSEVLYIGQDGVEVVKIGSTTQLSKKAFAGFIEEVIAWAAQYLSIQIPFPGELET